MANVKISALPVASNVASTDTFPFVQGAVTKQVTRDVLMELVSAGAGTASLPSYTFAGDAGTGMWSPAANTLAWSVNGSESMRLDSSGNLGIGTSSPVANLHVNTTVGNTVVHLTGALGATASNGLDLIVVAGGDASIWQRENNYLRFATNNTERMRLDSSGNLGIGTNSPVEKLHVDQGNFYAIRTGGAKLRLLDQNNEVSVESLPVGVSSDMVFRTSAQTRMTLDSSGNLGLGVTPSAWNLGKAIEVNNVGNALWGAAASEIDVSQNAYYNSGWKYAASSFATRYEQNTGVHRWFTAPSGTAGNAISFTQAMTLDASGNLLVGQNSSLAADCKFTAKNSTVATPTGAFWNATTTGDSLFLGFYTEASATLRGSIDYNRAGGLTRYNTTSDYRAKDIIGPVQNPGATIDALKVYEGVMKGATQSRPMLIAHEAQEHAPYAVSGVKDELNEDGTPKFQQMDVSSLVPLLLAEIQSLRARVAALELK